MKSRRRQLFAGGGWILALLGAGCSSPAAPADSAAGREAAEQARREERQKIMQQYWFEQTAVPAEPVSGTASGAGENHPTLAYPAGTYAGIRFGPRRAPDPSLAEPDR
jgi:hypothetical protein